MDNKFLFDRIAEAIQATGQDNEYSRGMCNGMLFVKSLIDGKEPEYFRQADAVNGGEPEELSEEEFREAILKFRPGLTVAEYPGALERARYPAPHTYFIEIEDGGRYIFPCARLTHTRYGDGRETYELHNDADELLLCIDAANVKRIARADKTGAKEKNHAESLGGGETECSLDYIIARLQEISDDTTEGASPAVTLRQKTDGSFEPALLDLSLSATLAYLRAFRTLLSADKGQEET